jgi:carboxy-terminal domain RNA polymerase II polypeptide A small phosphatase
MSSPATDAVRNVNGPEKDEEKATASIEEARPLDSQQPEPETAGDAEAVDATKAATVPASSPEEHLVPEEASKTKEVPPEQKTKAQKNTSDKPKPVAVSTRSKPSSLTKSLSNGKLFSRKTNGDPSKRGTPVMRGEVSNPSSASETLDLKKKKHKKRGRIWRFLHSCFTPSESHAIFDDFSAAASDSKKKRASANDVETSEKKNGDLTVDTAVANAAIAISAPIPSTPSKSHSAGATGVEVVVPPTPKHELLPLADTEGVTSGAVQAPGSTGLEVDDSEASITDDERHRPLDEEDDEERLIMNGGNGIPIGPVCHLGPCTLHTLSKPRMEKRRHYYLL